MKSVCLWNATHDAESQSVRPSFKLSKDQQLYRSLTLSGFIFVPDEVARAGWQSAPTPTLHTSKGLCSYSFYPQGLLILVSILMKYSYVSIYTINNSY